MTRRRALICGISGQDGAYLAELLLGKDYIVFGTSRDSTTANLAGLDRLGIRSRVSMVSMAPNDFRSVLSCLVETAPDEVYNLAGQSSVGLSFSQPVRNHREHLDRHAEPVGNNPLPWATGTSVQRWIGRMLR